MKTTSLYIILFSCSFFGCNVITTDTKMPESNVKEPEGISKYAQKLNIGFVDAPVYVWAEITGNLEIGDRQFEHILGVKFTYETGKVYDYYYETEGRLAINIEKHECRIVLYPGNGTIKLVCPEKETILFIVLEIEDDTPEWLRIPTTRINHNGELVSAFDLMIMINELDEAKYLVNFITDRGSFELHYQANKPITDLQEVSYLDRTDGRIYFLNQGEFLFLEAESDAGKF